ncbi:hypothetical protein JCM11251_007551 [Rhodosporidiobolus azoricus]
MNSSSGTLDDYILPFSLPGLASTSSSSSLGPTLPQPPRLASSSTSLSTPTSSTKQPKRTNSHPVLVIPTERNPSSTSSERPFAADMETRRKRSSTLTKRRTSDAAAVDQASPDVVAARAPRLKRPPKPLPGEIEAPQRGTSKDATARARASYNANHVQHGESGASLKIVLKRKKDPAREEGGQEATASPPLPISIDSTPAASPSVSRSPSPSFSRNGSSRSSSPAYIPAPSTSRSLSTNPPATRTVPTRSSAPLIPTVSLPYGGASKKSHQKNGKDGLNRVCHHHKSQTDRPRMTCVNAPECKTVWCNVCVEKYYLPQTPLNLFEAGGIFACPVCLDICSCAQCKRKRRGIGRDGSRRPPPSAAIVEGEEGDGGEKKKKKKGKKKKDRIEGETKEERKERRRREKKGKAKAVAVVDEDEDGGVPMEEEGESEDVFVPPPAPVSGRVGQMLAGMGAYPPPSAPARQKQPQSPRFEVGGGSSSEAEGGSDDEGQDVQRMLVDVDVPVPAGEEEEADEVPPLPDSAVVASFAVVPPPPPASALASPAPPLPSPPATAYPVDPALSAFPQPLKPPAPPIKRKKKGGNRRRSRPLAGAAAAAVANGSAARRASTGSTSTSIVFDPSAPSAPANGTAASAPAPPRRPRPRASAPLTLPIHAASLPSPYTTPSLFASTPDPSDTPFSYGHPLSSIAATAAASRPKRTKRPSSAFEDYAVDYASQYTNSSPAFNERVGDRNKVLQAQQRRQSGGSGLANQGFSAYPSREELEAAAQQQQQNKRRRYRSSGISSAGSSCAGLSGDEYEIDSLLGDEDHGAEEEEVVREVKPEEPLPVLAGLERNLGIRGPGSSAGEEGDEGDVSTRVDVDLDGDSSMISYAGESFDVGVIIPTPPPLPPTPPVTQGEEDAAKRQGKVVKWIEGPERRKRREERDKARETPPESESASRSGTGTVSPPVLDQVKVEDEGEDKTVATAPTPSLLFHGGEPIRPFGSPLLGRRRSSLTLISTAAPASAAVIAAGPSSTPAPGPAPLTATEPDEQPPPYDSLVPSAPPSSKPTSASAESPNAAVVPLPSSASPAQAAIEARSAEDTRIAFRLLDAVRAATAGYHQQSQQQPSQRDQDALDEAGVGAAMAAALTEGLGTSPSPTKRPMPVTGSPSSTLLVSATATLPPSRPASPAISTSSATSTSPAIAAINATIDPLEAQRLEAARRDLALAASVSVDPVKAFRREVRARARASGTTEEFWLVAAPAEEAVEEDGGEGDAAEEKHESVSERGAREFSTVSSSVSLAEDGLPPSAGIELETMLSMVGAMELDFEPLFAAAGLGLGSPHLVEDLWTPSSVAETSLSLASGASVATASTAASTVGLGGIECSAAPPTNGLGITPSPAPLPVPAQADDLEQYFAGCLAVRRPHPTSTVPVVVKQDQPLSFEAEMEKELGGVMEWMDGVEEAEGEGEGEAEVV